MAEKKKDNRKEIRAYSRHTSPKSDEGRKSELAVKEARGTRERRKTEVRERKSPVLKGQGKKPDRK